MTVPNIKSGKSQKTVPVVLSVCKSQFDHAVCWFYLFIFINAQTRCFGSETDFSLITLQLILSIFLLLTLG